MTKSVSLLLIVATLGLCALLTWNIRRNPAHIADPQLADGSNAARLATRIDPNTADWQTLAILPQLGQRRAKDIVAYRAAHNSAHPNQPAFSAPDDLLHVKGIGTAMLEALKPHLSFPATAPAD